MVHGLSTDLFDAYFAMIDDVDAGIVAAPLWKTVGGRSSCATSATGLQGSALEEVVSYPLVLCDPQVCEGCSRQRERLFRSVEASADSG